LDEGTSAFPNPVIQQLADDASFGWLIRSTAIAAPHYSLDDLVRLDSRLVASLQALRLVPLKGLVDQLQVLIEAEASTNFVLAVATLESIDFARAGELILRATASDEAKKAMVSAFCWLSHERVREIFQRHRLLERTETESLAIAALAARRDLHEAQIEHALRSPPKEPELRAIRAAGEMGLRSTITDVHHMMRSGSEESRFWCTWSSALLGDRNVGETLKSFVNFDTEFAYRAIQLAPRVLEVGNCQAWLRGLAQDETTRRYALIGCGVTGDPVYIPTLISQMAVPEYARVAGEAFSMITGVDLAYEDLDTDQPEGFEAGPTEDPADENVDLDPDEDLPWPNPELIDRWWHEHSREYQSGVRYLCGRPISEENCRRVLREGYQRQRISAAYELALMNPDEPLFEWRAPGFRQQEWLGLRKPSRRYRR
jgi:uncharacterized protein (TIGR02270 family)